MQMYICPTCGKELPTEPEIVKHFLKCWKEKHPYHKSKEAPRSADLVSRSVNKDTKNFFSQFSKG